jgi:hypothetical protein
MTLVGGWKHPKRRRVDIGIQEATIHSLETIPLAGVSISR